MVSLLIDPPAGDRRVRAFAAATSMLLVGAIAAMLVLGLRVDWQRAKLSELVSVAVLPERKQEPPPPPLPTRPHLEKAARGAPAPQAPAAAPVFAQPRPALAPPIVAVPLPSIGTGVLPGAGVVGLGQGAGGAGLGDGGGGAGGNGAGIAVKARQISGKLRFSDIPDGLLPPGRATEVGVIYEVEADGRVANCRIAATSGIARVDAVVCDLIERRFRYRPARDVANNPVPSTVRETHGWFVDAKETEAPAD